MDLYSRLSFTVAQFAGVCFLSAAVTLAGVKEPVTASSPPVPQPAPQAEPASHPCSAAVFRQFDFWVGEWRVLHRNGTHLGDNTISSEQSGCVIVEHWHGAKGGTGMSMSYYDVATKKWKQRWIGGPGSLIEMDGSLDARGAMVLTGPAQYYRNGRTTLQRTTWEALPDGRVLHLAEESEDGGETWAISFEGFYSRR